MTNKEVSEYYASQDPEATATIIFINEDLGTAERMDVDKTTEKQSTYDMGDPTMTNTPAIVYQW